MKKNFGKYRLLLAIICSFQAVMAFGQITPGTARSVSARADSIAPTPGISTPLDSAVVDLSKVKIASEGIDDIVDYKAQDSMWFDVINKQVHLYGNAEVKYTSLTVKAGYILLDYGKNEISAEGIRDTAGQMVGFPDFKDKDQAFTANKLRYNFSTRKGIIYEARSQQEDIFVLGQRAKFIGSADTTKKNIIYNSDAILTTCDAPHPHFGIHTKKLKVIPDKMVVTGFSNVEIAGIPTPLVLPFGFFPITKTRKAGLIIPQDFEFADQEGLGLRNFGWYQPINEHMDAKILFNAYVSGSLGISLDTRYDYIYKNNGNFLISFNRRVRENARAEKEAFRSFRLTWSHRQHQKAHPTRNFSGTVNIETNRDQSRNRNDYQSVIQNNLSSNLNYTQRFPGKPFQLSASMNHSQNTQSRQMTINLPNVQFNMQRIYPFKGKITRNAWYEKISLTYSNQLQNTFQATDTTLFTRQTLQKAKMGMAHRASTDFNFKLFKYINIAPSVNLEENWYPYVIEKQLLNERRLVYDTLRNPINGEVLSTTINESKSQYGIDTTIRKWGFYSYRNFNTSISANTVLFWTQKFKHGWFRGFRHKLTPSASVSFAPDFTKPKWGYFREVETDLRQAFNDTVRYGIFDEGIFGKPSFARQSVSIGYSLANLLEFKYFNAKKDTLIKKRIFDNLTFSGNYNLSADSLKWSPVTTGGVFRFFKGITNINWGLTLDPYINDARGNRINRFTIKEEGKLFRMSNLNVRLTTNLTIGQLSNFFKNNKGEKGSGGTPAQRRDNDDLASWIKDFRIAYNIGFERRLVANGFGTVRDTFLMSFHDFSVSGPIQLSSNWRINIGNISYNLKQGTIGYPDISFIRDLHCWEMSLSWQPTRNVYLFSIQVKPGSLEFLKVPYRKNNFERPVTF